MCQRNDRNLARRNKRDVSLGAVARELVSLRHDTPQIVHNE